MVCGHIFIKETLFFREKHLSVYKSHCVIPKGGLQNIQERTVGGASQDAAPCGLTALKPGEGHMRARHVVLLPVMYVSCFIIYCQPRVIIDSSAKRRRGKT